MDNLLILRHKYEYWKREYDRTRSSESLIQLHRWFQAYIQFVDNWDVPRDKISSISDKYNGCAVIPSEDLDDFPPLVETVEEEEKEEDRYAENIPQIKEYLEKAGTWCSAGKIGKTLHLATRYVLKLLKQMHEVGLVKKIRCKSGSVYWKISSTA